MLLLFKHLSVFVFWLFDGFHKILLNNVGYIHYTIAINEQWTPFNYNISIHLKKKIMNQFDFFLKLIRSFIKKKKRI